MAFEDNFLEEMKDAQRYLNRFFKKFEASKMFSFDNEFNDYRRALLDYKEDDNQFVISVELPGIERKDIKLDVDKNSVIIKAEKKKEKEVGSEEKGNYKYEKSYSGFYQEAVREGLMHCELCISSEDPTFLNIPWEIATIKTPIYR